MKQSKSVGGVVINREGLVLAVNQDGNSWSLPKGHIKEEETPLETAKREVYEESGITKLELVKDLGYYQRYKIGPSGKGEDKTELKTIFMFLFRTNQTELKPNDPRTPEVKWVKKEKVAKLLTHPKDKDFFLRIINEI
ncbi:MAG TPA: NUDIX domain-containing protein [Candidatus Bathyarchaeia archaeon]|nr:NUDIX domain-containing protein [Candidatus Bathyarchaeia archaeon]